jgi:hypothetical protein
MQAILHKRDIGKRANALRPGHSLKPVYFNVESLPRGNYHVIVPIEFDDGVKWVARVRWKGINQLPFLIVRQVSQAEIDTMSWLDQYEAAPVPKMMSPLYSKSGSGMRREKEVS